MGADSAAQMQAALALHQGGQLEAAQRAYEDILRQQPRHADALHLLGVLACQQQRYRAAFEHISQALRLNPKNPTYFLNRGLALEHLQQPDAALANYARAVALHPGYAQAHHNSAMVLRQLGRLAAALQACERALALVPDLWPSLLLKATLLQQRGALAAALQAWNRVLELQPDYADGYYNRGIVQHGLLQLDAAIASYAQTLALQPQHADAHWNQALAYLLAGDLARGWEGYEWRWRRADFTSAPRGFAQPQLAPGMDVRGKTVLLHAEQGLGDTLQFVRYAEPLRARGATVLLELPPSLCQLLRTSTSTSAITVLEQGSALPPFDLHCPLLSLPRYFGSTLDTLPAATPYLAVDPERRAYWQQRLGPATRPRIGLACSGSPTLRADAARSIPLATLLGAVPPGFEAISLQPQWRPADQPAARKLRHFGAALQDFSDTAALCTLVDLVLSVDTSVAHLGAALGCPTWVLLPAVPDWRWLLQREDSPWYPSARLWRQDGAGGWAPLLRSVRHELQEKYGSKPRGI